MKADPQYRSLMEKHGYVAEDVSLERITEMEREEMLGHVRKAIYQVNNMTGQRKSNTEQKFDRDMMELLITNMQAAEVYSPPRVAAMARTMGLKAGWSLDLATQDHDGRPWNFNALEMRNRAVRKIIEDQPWILIGSPMCTAFSDMNRINYSRMPKEGVAARMAYGRSHLELCAKLYAIQWEAGRYFLHEHPAEASSWQEECILKILKKQGVVNVVGDQCRYGLTSTEKHRTGLARKRKGFMTNSVCVAKRLEKRCPNKCNYQPHWHVRLENGRTRVAQEYPADLCKAICKGIMEQMETNRKGEFFIANIDQDGQATSKQLLSAQRELKSRRRMVEEEDEQNIMEAYDDVSGAQLDAKKGTAS